MGRASRDHRVGLVILVAALTTLPASAPGAVASQAEQTSPAGAPSLDLDWSIHWTCTICVCYPPFVCITVRLDVRVDWSVTACSDDRALLEWAAIHPLGAALAALGQEKPAGAVILNGTDGSVGAVGRCHTERGAGQITGGNCIVIEATLTQLEDGDPTAPPLHDEGAACFTIPVCFAVAEADPVLAGAWPCIP